MAYLSFPDFMEKKRYRFQSRLWEGDSMYRSKIWKAHRQEYARVCRFGKYANDQKLLDEEVMQYERRILEARKNSGMLTEKEFRQLQDELLMQFPLWGSIRTVPLPCMQSRMLNSSFMR